MLRADHTPTYAIRNAPNCQALLEGVVQAG